MFVRQRARSLAWLLLACAAFIDLGSSPAKSSTYSGAIEALSPVSYYQFNGSINPGGTAVDDGSRTSTVGYYAATYTGGVSAGPGVPLPGLAGSQSLSLSETAYADGSDAGLPTGNTPRTVTAWINTTQSAASSYNTFVYYGITGGGNDIFTFIPYNQDGNSNPDYNNPSNPVPGTAGNFGLSQYGNGLGGITQVNDGNWHFVAFTGGNPTTVMTMTGPVTYLDYNVYVDGKLDGGLVGYGGPKTMQTNTTLNGSSFSLGDASLFPGTQYNGLLAQVAIFNTALSATQISNLYQAAVVPEPSTLAIGSLGIVGLVWLARSSARCGLSLRHRACPRAWGMWPKRFAVDWLPCQFDFGLDLPQKPCCRARANCSHNK